MPRRSEPDPLAQIVGLRIRQLRLDLGLTMEQLAFESELGSKGHLSNIERGLARPTIYTLKVLADRLEVKLLDLVTFPDEDERQRLVDATRSMSRGTVRKILKETAVTPKKAPAPAAKEATPKRRRASGNKRSR